MPSRKTRASSCSSSSTAGSSPLDASSLSRQQRNLAEKQRRDKLNSYIAELSTLVPMVTHSVKKLDKTSILRLAAAHLRLHHSSLNPKNGKKEGSWCPSVLDSEKLNELMMAIDGFVIVTTVNSKILFVSRHVENYLGHQDIEMIGHSLMYFMHPEDHSQGKAELKKLVALSISKKFNSAGGNHARCTFCARIRERSQPRSEIINYQLMRFSCLYSNDINSNAISNRCSTIAQRHRTGNNLCNGVLKMYIQPINPNPFDELSIAEAFQDEYVTQHSPTGEILYADHRISTITGHLPHEVIGMLAYEYIFEQDVPVAQFAQRLMFSSSNGTGMIVYRLKSRNSTAVYLKSTGYLEYDKSSTQVSHFVCINRLLSHEEGEQELKKFNDRYNPRITGLCCFSSKSALTVKTCQAIDCESSLSPELSSPDVLPLQHPQFQSSCDNQLSNVNTSENVRNLFNDNVHPLYLSPKAIPLPSCNVVVDMNQECTSTDLIFADSSSTSCDNFPINTGYVAVTDSTSLNCMHPTLNNGDFVLTMAPKGQKRPYSLGSNTMVDSSLESKFMKYDSNQLLLENTGIQSDTTYKTLVDDWRALQNGNSDPSYVFNSNLMNGNGLKEDKYLDDQDTTVSAQVPCLDFNDIWNSYDSHDGISCDILQNNRSSTVLKDKQVLNGMLYDFAP